MRQRWSGFELVVFLTYYMTMIRINVAEAKARLSHYLETVEGEETIVVCRRNVPIAEIRPLPQQPRELRPVGIDRGMIVPASFFEPLSPDLLDAFEGDSSSE